MALPNFAGNLCYNKLMINFIADPNIEELDLAPARSAYEQLKSDSMAGWLNVPVDADELMRIKRAANQINSDSDYLVCIGIGGSYLGHKAITDVLGTHGRTKILYAGNSLSAHELQKVLNTIKDHDFSINIISKSGTTLEPAIAFRLLKQELVKKYGAEQAAARIYATTDANHGALHDEAVKNNYQRFVVPDNIGGRYSVFTAVGLLPLACAGIDVDALLAGAKSVAEIATKTAADPTFDSAVIEADPTVATDPTVEPADPTVDAEATSTSFNTIASYAVSRQMLYQEQGRETEVLATFEPRLATLAEWWKQLFGESEGKGQQGIFPASVIYTTDLHSLGQYLQQGRRNLFETVVKITTPSTNSQTPSPASSSQPSAAAQPTSSITIPETSDNLDNLNYLAGKSLAEINNVAAEATIKAHRAGGIPVLEIHLPDLSERTLGELIYFFELACALSAKISGVNPFDQPGVEAYKKNMFSSLGRPES